jgi:hypothetical protein
MFPRCRDNNKNNRVLSTYTPQQQRVLSVDRMRDGNKEDSQKQLDVPFLIAMPMITTPIERYENVLQELNVIYSYL